MAKKVVTPFVGVWIETTGYTDVFVCDGVTPFVGVWIETYQSRDPGNQC